MLSFMMCAYATKKLAYVTDSAQENYVNDIRILPMLRADSNFVVTEINAASTSQDLSGFDLIVIAKPSGLSGSDALIPLLKGYNKPILNMKVLAYRKNTWEWVSENGSIVDNYTALKVVVFKPAHPIFTGMTVSKGSEIQLLSTVSGTTLKGLNGVTSFLNVANGTIDTLATIKDAAIGQLCITEIPVGVSVNGTFMQHKFVQIGISGTSYANITTEGLQLIKNASYYLAGMEIPNSVNNPSVCALKVRQTSQTLTVDTTEDIELSIYSVSGQIIHHLNGN